MDTPGIQKTPAQWAAELRFRAAHVALNNVLANRENYLDPVDFGNDKQAAKAEMEAARAEYEGQFAPIAAAAGLPLP